MLRPSKETLNLTPDQCERAVRLAMRMRDDDSYVESPADLVDSWEEPDTTIDRDRKVKRFDQTEAYISPSAIVGSLGMSHRLERNRIKKILGCMLNNEYEVEHSIPPSLQRRNDKFYVGSDGHHRCMVAKAIGLDELYVQYETVPQELLVPSPKE